VHEISRARLVQGLKALHAPFEIYTACEHLHDEDDEDAFYIEDVGWSCEAGLVAVVCQHCCVDDHAQADVCVERHKHEAGRALCPTTALMTGLLSPWDG
jgi:hypothetical protein